MNDTALQLAWMAGFFDGEGCVSLAKCTQRKIRASGEVVTYVHFQMMAIVTQEVEAPIREFQRRFGGKVRRITSQSNKPHWVWRASGKVGKAALIAMLPYMRVKAEAAEIAIRTQQLVDDFRAIHPRWNIPIPEHIREAQSLAHIAVRAINAGPDKILSEISEAGSETLQ